MKTNLKETSNNQTTEASGFDSQEKTPTFHIQSGLRAGVKDSSSTNDRQRASRFSQAAADFIERWFS